MTGDYYLLRTDEQKANAAAAVSLCKVDREKPSAVQIVPYAKDRSEAQNRLSHRWYAEISKQGGEYTPEQIKSRCKYHYGIPLLSDDKAFCVFWERVLTTDPTYEQIVDEIMPITPVTRRMKVSVMAQYLTDIERVHGQKYKLTIPALYGL